MTIAATKTKEVYNGNGTTTTFPVPFPYSEADNITLVYTDAKGSDALVTSNYKITVNESGDTNVIYPVVNEPMKEGTKLTIYRNTPLTQIVSLSDLGEFSPEELEKSGFDRTVMMIQELQEELDRSIKVSMQSHQTPEELLEDIFLKQSQSIQASIEAKQSLNLATTQANIATKAADKSTSKAQEAVAAAEQAMHAASNIEGFAKGTHAFHGIKFDEDMNVIWTKGEDGETFNQKDFLYSAILPTGAKFFLEHGQLFVELPFTQ